MTAIQLVSELDDAIQLRPPTKDDARGLLDQVNANREYLKEWLGWVDACRSTGDIREFVDRVDESHREGHSLTDLIIHNGTVAGVISIQLIDWINLNAGIGYWLAAPLQGRGIVTRACACVLDYMFDQLSLHRAEIRCAQGNVRSQGIPKRLGFTYEGTVRQAGRLDEDRYIDLMVFSMLEQEWRERR